VGLAVKKKGRVLMGQGVKREVWGPNVVSLSVGVEPVSRWWEDICDLFGVGGHCSWLKAMVTIGSGTQVSFWNDRWLNGECLRVHHERLFNIAINKSCSVRGVWVDGRWEWSRDWCRSYFVYENDLFDSFCQDLRTVSVFVGVSDTWVWRASDSGIYIVKYAYKVAARSSTDALLNSFGALEFRLRSSLLRGECFKNAYLL
jgi:hypothetical protein